MVNQHTDAWRKPGLSEYCTRCRCYYRPARAWKHWHPLARLFELSKDSDPGDTNVDSENQIKTDDRASEHKQGGRDE